MAKYLVTGGAGFIGSNLTHKILANGDSARVLDNLSTGRLENLEDAKGDFEFINGDICDLSTVMQAAEGVDYILHQAALPSVQRSVENPLASNENNVNGTLNVLMAAREYNVKRYVMASSSSVYGNTPTLPKVESMPTMPLSPYAVSKLAAERYAMSFHTVYGVPTVAFRYFNVFGPRQDPNSHYAAVIPLFINALLNHESPIVHGDGEQSRDFTFIDNVVYGNLLACESDAASGNAMNLACGDRITLNELLEKLENIIGVKANAKYVDNRKGDVKHSQAGIELARKLMKFEPQVLFDEGLQKTVEYYQSLMHSAKVEAVA
ncbi:MAG: SDR family oxidoreductase [Deferribacteres bacterium]|nr:SDR family oxidoreductase [candidate division KSB1 bacterium]MCB9501797.1 SDR family oxidoreductase [Deferribacteres bacterium]